MKKFYTVRTFQLKSGHWKWEIYYKKMLMLEGQEIFRDAAAFAAGLHCVFNFGCNPADWLTVTNMEFDMPF